LNYGGVNYALKGSLDSSGVSRKQSHEKICHRWS